METSPTSDLSLCSSVRSSCAALMEASSFVVIDASRLRQIAADLPAEAEAPLRAGSLTAVDEAHATLVFALDAINFGSGYHDVVRKGPGLSGARTMSTALRNHVASNGPLTAVELEAITPRACSSIFGQELDGGSVQELMEKFAVALNDLGRFLTEHGGAVSCVQQANRSAEGLAKTLTAMPFYRDVTTIDGIEVAFYKRAQITPADLCREFGRRLFDDLAALTAFADNLVPHVLRVDGALAYRPELTAAIDRGEALDPGARAETEIRAAGVVCVDRLSELTGRTAMDLDLLLWERGGDANYKAVPRHRARSVFY